MIHKLFHVCFVVIHCGVLLLAAYYGAHVGEGTLVICAAARLVAPANLTPFIGSAPLCLGLWRWRGSLGLPLAFLSGAGTDGLDIFGRSCRRLCTSFLMCVSSYKASSRDHCCPRRSDMAAQSLRSADKSSCVFTVRRPKLGSGCVGYLFVEGLEIRQVRCLAQG